MRNQQDRPRHTLTSVRLLVMVAFAAVAVGVVDTRAQTSATRIAFATHRDGNSEIYVMRTDGSGLRNLTRNPATDSLPTWSPVLRRLAFQSDRDGENALYSMRADGSDLRRLAATPADGVGFHWSPDGTRFVFLLPAGGPREIRVMDSGGTGVRNLSGHDATLEYDPAWSPDGTRVAFTSNRNGPRAIFAVDAARGEVMQLIAPVGIDESAAWSPDGRQLAFSSRRLNPLDIDIYVADLGGANTRNISQTPGRDTLHRPSGDMVS